MPWAAEGQHVPDREPRGPFVASTVALGAGTSTGNMSASGASGSAGSVYLTGRTP